MIICTALSDAHGWLPRIETESDLFLLCGDFTPTWIYSRQRQWEWFDQEFKDWIRNLPYIDENSKAILVPGNHDFALESLTNKKRGELLDGTANRLIFLDNEEYVFKKDDDEYRIFGCPYCKNLPGWAFCRPEENLKKYYDPIPEGLDILLLHDAPDIMRGGVSEKRVPVADFGNKTLAEYVYDRKPDFTFFGHIHTSPLKKLTEYSDGKFIANVSLLDERYKVAYMPLTVKIGKERFFK